MALRIDIVTLFPEIFFGPLKSSIVGRACEKELVEINAVNLRDFTHDRHQTVDDVPYGGGPGMLLKADVLTEAVLSLKRTDTKVILTGPRGERFNQKIARELAQESHLVILCGHYEGVDERVRQTLVDREISIGDYILTSGNLAAMQWSDFCRVRWEMMNRATMNPLKTGFWNIRNTQDRPNSTGCVCRMCCFPAIMKRSPSGAKPSPCGSRWRIVRI